MKVLAQNQLFFLLLLIFTILRIPSLAEPYWYGDEGVYQVIGAGVREGRMFYTQVWDNKPPLLFFIYSIFNGEQYLLRMVNLVWGLAVISVFYILTRKILVKKNRVAAALLTLTILLGLPILEGNIANAENFLMLFTLISMTLIVYFYESKRKMIFFIAGILMGLAFMIKVVAVFDLGAVILFLLFSQKIKKVIFYCLGFVSPVFMVSYYFMLRGNFLPFVETAFSGNISYVGYGNTLVFKYGLLVAKLVVLVAVVLFLYLKRSLFPREQIFIYLWFSFSLFSVFFSGRGHLHYLLLLLPAFCLILGLALGKGWERRYLTYVLVFTIVLARLAFPIYINIPGYYLNYIAYKSGRITWENYLAFFDPNTVITYKVAEYIKDETEEQDRVFVWGNSPQVYKLADKLPPGRFSAAYHVLQSESTLKETEAAFEDVKPKLIVILKDESSQFPFSLDKYQKKTTVSETEIYERVVN